MIAEGPKHPDLVEWYWDNVVSRVMNSLRSLIAKGVDSGEFRETALNEFPQLLVTPVFFSMIFTIVFKQQMNLDTDRFIETHITMVLEYIKADPA